MYVDFASEENGYVELPPEATTNPWVLLGMSHQLCIYVPCNLRIPILRANLQIVCVICRLRIIHSPRNLGIAHEFRLHARAASSSDVSTFSTMSTSAEVQHRKLFEEFCTRKYAAARNKTISQLEEGSEFTERCDTGGGAQVRHSSRIVRLHQTTQNHGKAITAENCSLVQA